MTQSKHTPAPWFLSPHDMQSGTSDTLAIVYNIERLPTECGHGSSIGYISANKPCYEISVHENLANAHLIAAAPELLAALKLAQGWIMDYVPLETQGREIELKSINAAIAKAEGRA